MTERVRVRGYGAMRYRGVKIPHYFIDSQHEKSKNGLVYPDTREGTSEEILDFPEVGNLINGVGLCL